MTASLDIVNGGRYCMRMVNTARPDFHEAWYYRLTLRRVSRGVARM